jgi:hypothetical protein
MKNLEDNRVVVRTGTGLRTDVAANGYALVADEPPSVGARAQGPRLTITCLPRLGRAPR